MLAINKKEPYFLFLGDILVMVVTLWLSLVFRYWELPSLNVYLDHLRPFSILFAVWVLVFFVAGLYEKHTTVLTGRLSSLLFNSLLINAFIAVTFFYLFPIFGLTPKTLLLIYLIVSLILSYIWRYFGHRVFCAKTRERAIIVGSGEEPLALRDEVNGNPRYGLEFISSIDLDRSENLDFQKEILERVYSEGVSTVVVDLRNDKVEPILPHLYNLIFSKVKFIDMHKIYEDVFDRVPLSLLKYNWFIENISLSPRRLYEFASRLLDIVIALVLLPVFLLFYVIIFFVKKLEDNRSIIISQERIGQNGKVIKIIKFRSWLYDDKGDEELKKINKPTAIGNFLRRYHIDEIPQVWNVLRGDLSFIGPRPEMPVLVRLYEKEIPYYSIRHLIKPGLSGWAQLYQRNPPKHDANFNDTRVKLSYDLYYIENRSLLLDLKIMLRTVKSVLTRSGQ
jgi:lipopolysaccharide/colanic/teichoic acid biosynthesis glycosyltransferase